MNNWFKMYIKFTENPVWQHDNTAWKIFEYLLARAYTGNPQGTVSTSRQQIGIACFVNNNTAWSALLRLKKAKMVDIQSNNRFSTIRICNWHEYQYVHQQLHQQPVNNQSTTSQHSYKNKIKIKKILTEKTLKENTPNPPPDSRGSRESANRARKRLEEKGLLRPKETI